MSRGGQSGCSFHEMKMKTEMKNDFIIEARLGVTSSLPPNLVFMVLDLELIIMMVI